MERRFNGFILSVCAMIAFLGCCLTPPTAFGGPLRINLSNGTSLEVPYYWEENGEIKFEMPGGVAGIPKTSVRSVQEIIALREFDPEEMVESNSVDSANDREQILLELAEKQNPSSTRFEKIDPDESLALFDKMSPKESSVPGERIYGPMFSKQGDFTELVRLKGNGLMLVMQNILTSRDELNDRRFSLVLYDSEGNILQTRPCDLYKLDVDPKTMKRLGIRGKLFSVIATIKPDPRISRYEISSARRY